MAIILTALGAYLAGFTTGHLLQWLRYRNWSPPRDPALEEFDDLVTETFKRCGPELTDNVTRNNALIKARQESAYDPGNLHRL